MPSVGKNVLDAIAALDNGSDSVGTLEVRYGAESIPKPGARLANKAVASPPTISAPGLNLSPTKRYLLAMLDPDAPLPSFPIMGPICHWLQADLSLSSSASSSDPNPTATLTPSSPPIWTYHGAGPPPFSPPHKYIFVLYEQPEAFDVAAERPAEGSEAAIWPRVRWDHGAWERRVGVGRVVAANYFVAGST